MEVTRRIVEIDEELCDGCGQCVPACAEGAIEVVDGKARLVAEKYCDGLGACLGECPNGAITVVEREADEFEEEAVEAYLRSKADQGRSPEEVTMACGCPSSHIETLNPPVSCQEANAPGVHKTVLSELSHWPVQIRLVPPTAPFLKGAHLLVAADCTAVAYPNFHQELLRGRVIMVGCPKFDDAPGYIQNFADIFEEAEIKGVTVVVMEVPCCSALPVIVRKGMELAGRQIPLEEIVITRRGEILKRHKMAS